MDISESTRQLTLTPNDNKRLAKLCGQFDENLHLIERHLGVAINNRGNDFQIIGIPNSIDKAADVLKNLYKETAHQRNITANEVLLHIHETHHQNANHQDKGNGEYEFKIRQCCIKARNPNQKQYINAIQKHDINFGIGPSGTGKTFLAVACAVSALEEEKVSRIILTRPAVEAGEKLGYLPGDLTQKIDPYLRPLYDGLCEILGVNKGINHFLEKGVIEIAPLAFMRGRTLNDSFVILDEAQNATREQMKMFLTRIGFGSKAVITGDITQTDLPTHTKSGLMHAINLLQNIDHIQFTFFNSEDIIRHPIVKRIIEAYEAEEDGE